MSAQVRAAALQWIEGGFSVLPIRTDGSKAPYGDSWKRWMSEQPGPEQAASWWPDAGRLGVGVVMGAVSGNAEMLELEGRFVHRAPEVTALADASGLGELWRRVTSEGYVERSPSGGVHMIYRVEGAPVPGNAKIARRPATAEELAVAPGERVKVLVETRGEGGQVVVAPTGAHCHASGRGWEVLSGVAGRVVTITADEREALHTLLATFDEMPHAGATASVVPRQGGQQGGQQGDASGGELRPGDDYEARTDWSQILEPHGWTHVFTGSDGTRYWRRPGKTVGISASSGGSRRDRDRLYVFTTSTEFEAETPYTKLGALAVLEHGGSHAAAASALRRAGYGGTDGAGGAVAARVVEADVSRLTAWADGLEVPDRGVAPVTGGDARDEPASPVLPNLPAEFWAARPALKHLEVAAASRVLSPDAVLGCLLARLSSYVRPSVRVQTGIGEASLNVFSVVVGDSSAGKSEAWGAAAMLLRGLPSFLFPGFPDNDGLPIGSGEGLAEAYFGMKDEPTGETYKTGERAGEEKTVKVRRKIYDHALFYADEGEGVVRMMERNGATLATEIRRAWKADGLGQANASAERRRIVQGGSFAMGVTLAFQPATIGPLFEDAAGGTPQRFLFLSAHSDAVSADRVPWPGELANMLHALPRETMTLPQSAQDEIWQRRVEARKVGAEPSGMDGHWPLHRAKLAALLAVLDHRHEITDEDWQLGGVLWETSRGVRGALVAAAEAERARRARVEDERRVRVRVRGAVDGAQAAAERHAQAVESLALWVARKVRQDGLRALTGRGGLRAACEGRKRGLLDEALEQAAGIGWVTVDRVAGSVEPGPEDLA